MRWWPQHMYETDVTTPGWRRLHMKHLLVRSQISITCTHLAMCAMAVCRTRKKWTQGVKRVYLWATTKAVQHTWFTTQKRRKVKRMCDIHQKCGPRTWWVDQWWWGRDNLRNPKADGTWNRSCSTTSSCNPASQCWSPWEWQIRRKGSPTAQTPSGLYRWRWFGWEYKVHNGLLLHKVFLTALYGEIRDLQL